MNGFLAYLRERKTLKELKSRAVGAPGTGVPTREAEKVGVRGSTAAPPAAAAVRFRVPGLMRRLER